jgi:hypothetical protein
MDTKKFLVELSKTGIVGIACKKSRIARSSYNRKIKKDLKFKQECDDAIESAIDEVELELRRRAIHGTAVQTLHNGQVVYSRDENGELLYDEKGHPIPFTTVKHSDPLMRFYMEKNRSKYGDLNSDEDVPDEIIVEFVK